MNTSPWVAVMSQSMMKLFSRDIDSDELQYLKTIRNDVGRVRSRFLGRHDRGYVTEGGQRGKAMHSLDAGQDAHSTAADAFARRIAKVLNQERVNAKFSSLTIIAEPKFQGRLRKAMNHETLRSVARWIPKDLEKAPTEAIKECFIETLKSERQEAFTRLQKV